MGNSCPPCQAADRPFYDMTTMTLKLFECVQEKPTEEEISQCMQTYKPDMMTTLKKTNCKDADLEEGGELTECFSKLPRLEKVQALKECNEAVFDYYLNKPNEITSVNIGEPVLLENFCAVFINMQEFEAPEQNMAKK